MATRTQSRASNRSSSNSNRGATTSRGNANRSAFSWGESRADRSAPRLPASASASPQTIGRKALMQGMEAMAGDWDEILAAEHDMALAIFDKMLATDETQTFKRKMLLMKLTHALDKHAHQEEMVVYPALREANEDGRRRPARRRAWLHQDVHLRAQRDGPGCAELAREGARVPHSWSSSHAHMEEEQVFPRFKQTMTRSRMPGSRAS